MTTPQKAAIEALEAMERLANVPMNCSLAEWQSMCSPIIKALTTLRANQGCEVTVDLEKVRDVVRPFALAFRASEKVIVKDMPASDRVSHVVRSTSYWLSYKHFKDASELLNDLASVQTDKGEG